VVLSKAISATRRPRNAARNLWSWLYNIALTAAAKRSHLPGSNLSVRTEAIAQIEAHRLEKSLSATDWQPGRGQKARADLDKVLAAQEVPSEARKRLLAVAAAFDAGEVASSPAPGAYWIDRGQRALDDPDEFFTSRRSVRELGVAPTREQIERAVGLARSAPSVCNRQAARVHATVDLDLITAALLLQNGNAGFGDRISCLMAVTSDRAAFPLPHEMNQTWIDGSLFAMTLVWAFHSTGISTCCLNWAASPTADAKPQNLWSIPRSEAVVMLVAAGLPDWPVKVAGSSRRSVAEVLSFVQSSVVP